MQTRLIARARARLIHDGDGKVISAALRRYSVRLAGLAATLATIVVGNQGLALSLLSMLPTNSFARLVAAVSIGLVVFVVPTLAVLWKQGPTDAQR